MSETLRCERIVVDSDLSQVWPESGAVRLTGLPHGDLGGLAGGQMARTEVAYSWRRVLRHRAEVWSTFKLFVPTPPEGLLPPAI